MEKLDADNILSLEITSEFDEDAFWSYKTVFDQWRNVLQWEVYLRRSKLTSCERIRETSEAEFINIEQIADETLKETYTEYYLQRIQTLTDDIEVTRAELEDFEGKLNRLTDVIKICYPKKEERRRMKQKAQRIEIDPYEFTDDSLDQNDPLDLSVPSQFNY